METKKTSITEYALKWGAIIGAISIALSFILFLTNQMENRLLPWLITAITIVIYYLQVKNYRDKELNGFMNFNSAFGLCFQMSIFSGILNIIYAMLFRYVISPNTFTILMDHEKQKMYEKGLTEDQVDTAMKYANMFQTPIVLLIMMIVGTLIMGAIISLIVAAICKKEKSLFAEEFLEKS